MIPSSLRKVLAVSYVRQRLELGDGDFLDLDWSQVGAARVARVAVICHGLEGNSQRPYMRGMVRALNRAGWDAVAVNFRGCSGEPNRLAHSYHSGLTVDLRDVLAAVTDRGYAQVVLVGFSLGGNLILKYLGEDPTGVPPEVLAGVTISVPLDLADTSRCLVSPRNRIYHARFMQKLRRTVRLKAQVLPDEVDVVRLNQVHNIIDFDDQYTAPLNGFVDAADYYARNSARNWLDQIAVPTLVLSAANDPFLGPRCFPREVAAASPSLCFEEPAWGGHVGFYLPGAQYYSEQRAVEFAGSVARGDGLL